VLRAVAFSTTATCPRLSLLPFGDVLVAWPDDGDDPD